jgi:hypothetical protein
MADALVSRRGELRYPGRRVAVSDLRRRNPTTATRRVRCRNVRRPRPETGYLFIDETYARSDTFSYTTVLRRRIPMVADSRSGSKPATFFTARGTAPACLRRYVNFKITRNRKLNSLFSRRSDIGVASIRSRSFGKVPNLVRSCVRWEISSVCDPRNFVPSSGYEGPDVGDAVLVTSTECMSDAYRGNYDGSASPHVVVTRCELVARSTLFV